MARVSLIVPTAPGATRRGEGLELYRQVLEHQGHTVELIVPEGGDGLAAAAVEGLRAADGDVLVILDPTRGYTPEGLADVIAPVVRGDTELAVASRPGHTRNLFVHTGMRVIARPLLGVSEPGSGLIALSRRAARAADHDFRPIGTRFALELLARVEGRRCEVSVAAPPHDRERLSLKLTDLRHVKRLADDRFGNASRLVQFCMVGASGMVVDLTCYALFQLVFSRTGLTELQAPFIGGTLDLAVAGALAIAVALVWNFSLNRRLTFSYARQGSVPRQLLTYALSNALGIALSLTLRLYLPLHIGFFERHRLAAALVGIVTATGISFSLSRWVVFRRHSTTPEPSRLTLAEAALADSPATP